MNQFLVIHGTTALSLFEKDASSSAVRVFMTLCLYANVNDNTCFPSIGRICADANIGERTARESLDWLVAHGFIEREKCFDDSGRQTSNTYIVRNKGALHRRGEGAADRSHPGALHRTPRKSTNKERESEVNKGTPFIPLKGNEKKRSGFVVPSLDEVTEYAFEIGMTAGDGESFHDHFTANGWKVGKGGLPMKDWKAAMRNWKRNAAKFSQTVQKKETFEERMVRLGLA